MNLLLLMVADILGAKEKHGLKAEALREMGNVQYSVRNVRYGSLMALFYYQVFFV